MRIYTEKVRTNARIYDPEQDIKWIDFLPLRANLIVSLDPLTEVIERTTIR